MVFLQVTKPINMDVIYIYNIVFVHGIKSSEYMFTFSLPDVQILKVYKD